MKFYRIDIEDRKIVECNEITKKSNLYDYLLIKQYKGFLHFDPTTLNPTAYLCKADSYFEAKEKAQGFLERTSTNSHRN
jgi:hypothetical protein